MGQRSSVQIVVNAEGVEVVRLCGRSWDDEPDARKVYDKIRHLVSQIDLILKGPEAQVLQ